MTLVSGLPKECLCHEESFCIQVEFDFLSIPDKSNPWVSTTFSAETKLCGPKTLAGFSPN